MTHEPDRRRRPPGDEGAPYTAAVMAGVKRLRQAKTWSAERLAGEMAAVGVPWTRDAVVNLETGRRKRLAVHELLALAYVLDMDAPAELLAPGEDVDLLPIAPLFQASAGVIRAWLRGETGPLRSKVAEGAREDGGAFLAEAARKAGLTEEQAAELRRLLGGQLYTVRIGRQPGQEDGGDGAD